MIRAVLFDVDFTLIQPGPMFRAEGYHAFCSRFGIAVDPSMFDQAVVSAAPILDGPEDLPYDAEIFVDYTRHTDLLKSSATLSASKEVHDAMLDVIHDVFARADELERGDDVLAALRDSLRAMFPDRKLTQKEQVRIGEGHAKSIFMHAYMDRHDFDLERLRKCCHHYPQADGRVMPACGFNMFHRGAAKGPDTPRPSWAVQAAEDGKKRLRVVTG